MGACPLHTVSARIREPAACSTALLRVKGNCRVIPDFHNLQYASLLASGNPFFSRMHTKRSHVVVFERLFGLEVGGWERGWAYPRTGPAQLPQCFRLHEWRDGGGQAGRCRDQGRGGSVKSHEKWCFLLISHPLHVYIMSP